jgi:acyl dehydratase
MTPSSTASATRTFHGTAALRALRGQGLGTTSWHSVTQAAIDAFAQVTEDDERIHLDPEASPFGVTIAHGLYTLALGPKFLHELFRMEGHSLALNYGFDRVRFISPVRVGSRVRMTAHLSAVDPIPAGRGRATGWKFHITEIFEIEGEDRPACVADAVVAWFD